MADEYIYCHGSRCHKKHTQDRIRGVKGSKVLRTKKIKVSNWYNKMYQYFCSQGCYDNFANDHIEQIVAIAPRTEPLETPIDDPVRERSEYGYYNTTIKERGVDTSME